MIQHSFVSDAVGLKLIVGVKRAMPTYSLVVDGKGWGTRVMTWSCDLNKPQMIKGWWISKFRARAGMRTVSKLINIAARASQDAKDIEDQGQAGQAKL